MPNLRARTKTACEIALLDPDRFNEAVHAGFYECAPRTRPGSSRIFDVNDIVALCIYRRLMDEGIAARTAGHLACEMRYLIRQHPEADRVLHVVASIGSDAWLLPEHFDSNSTHIGGADIVSIREWRLQFLRARIIHQLEDAAGIVGED